MSMRFSAQRVRLLAQNLRFLSTRLRLRASISKNMRGGRLRLSSQSSFILRTRLLLDAPVPLPALVVPPLPPTLAPQLFTSQGPVLPLVVPPLAYQVNGMPLDTPLVCTAPGSTGLLVLAGSTFFLTFQNPSALTQQLLVLGIATMTFALVTGEMVTGSVFLTPNQSGATLVLTVVTQMDIWVDRWVVSSQFP